MGHGDAWGEESHQPDADGKPRKTHHGGGGPQTSLDLRKYFQNIVDLFAKNLALF